MRLSDLTNIDEAWYDPRTWGKQARQNAAGSKIGAAYATAGKVDAQNAAGSRVAAAPPKPTKTATAKPTSTPATTAPAAPAVDTDLEQRKEMARLFGTSTASTAAPAAAAKPSAALAPSQVAAATPPAANNMKNAADVMRSGQASNQANKAAPVATAEPDPYRFGKPNVNIDPTNTGAAAKPAAEPQATTTAPAAEPAPATAPAGQAAMSYAGNQGGAAEAPPPPTVKTQTPAGPIMAEEITMKKLLDIFEAKPNDKGWEQGPNYKFPPSKYEGDPRIQKDTTFGYGRYGKHSAALQSYLNKIGMTDDEGKPLELDARYGPKTMAALQKARNTLDPKSPEYAVLRQLDANTRTSDPDSRIQGPVKKVKPVDKPEPAAEPTAVDTTSKPSDMKNAGDVYRAAQQDKNSNTVSAAPTNIVSYDNKFYDRDGTGDLDQPGVDTDTDTGAAAKPAAPTDKTPDNVGPIVRTGTGGTLTTSDGTPVRSRSADEIEWQMKNPMQTYPGADAVAKQKEQGEQNWKSFKNFLGVGEKPAASVPPTQGGGAKPAKTPEVMIENELSEIMRLSGLKLNEKAVSKQQQKFMGMVHAMQKGEKVKGASPELKKAAKGMSKKSAHDFAATKHKGLPQQVNEDIMSDEDGRTLKHITNRFKHEVHNFMNSGRMDNDLYHALHDYYRDTGKMPYSVIKDDPQGWIEEHFYMDMGSGMSETAHQGHNTLSELARLAGLHESKIDECGDMPMNQSDTFNVSTNMSSDGTKSINISAQGDKADELMQMLKMAGMRPHDDHDRMSHEQPEIVLVSGNDQMMEDSGGVQVHDLSGMSGRDLYDETQTNDSIHDGDVLVTNTGVGIMVEAWPVIVAGDIEGFHKLKDGTSWDEFEGGQYAESAKRAMEVSGQELDEERVTQYSNTPEEEYETVAAITRQGNDLNREKQQWNPDRGRDNPMAIELEESLAEMLESIKVVEGGNAGGIDAEQPYKDPKTGKMITPPRGATMPPPDNEFPAGDKRNLIPPKQKGVK